MARELPPFPQEIDADLDALRHPDYDRMYRRWKMQWDFWRGGLHVLSPDWPATNITRARMIRAESPEEGERPEPERDGSRYEWFQSEEESYLWKHMRETDNEYEDRQARQDHLPLFQSIVNIFVSGILRAGARYDIEPSGGHPFRDSGKDLGQWRGYHEDVDQCGTGLASFIRQALSIAIAMGRCHAVTDRPNSGQAQSLLEEEQRGDRVYSWLVTPLDLVDWELDGLGKLIWARIREPDKSMDSWRRPTDDTLCVHFQYRVWHRNYWELYRLPREDADATTNEESKWTRVAAAWHNVGEVPISTLYAGKDGRPVAMNCESPLAGVCDADRKIHNRRSEMDELERAQAFAMLAIPEAESGPAGGVDLGPFRAFTYDSDAGAPSYISPDQAILAGKAQRIAEDLHVVRQLAGAGRGRAEFSKEERSASALSLESSEKQNLMAWWAGSTQEFDNALHRHAAKWDKRETWPKASYDRTFDLRSISSQIQDLVQLATVEVLKPVVAELGKPVVARILREAGVDDDVVDAAMKKIDEEAAQEPAPPTEPMEEPVASPA